MNEGNMLFVFNQRIIYNDNIDIFQLRYYHFNET